MPDELFVPVFKDSGEFVTRDGFGNPSIRAYRKMGTARAAVSNMGHGSYVKVDKDRVRLVRYFPEDVIDRIKARINEVRMFGDDITPDEVLDLINEEV